MDKPMNRIKEVLEERGIKQTWAGRETRQEFLYSQCVCMQQTATKFGSAI